MNQRYHQVQLLLSCEADLAATDGEGNSALLLAAQQGHLAVVRLLLIAGADVDAANTMGVRPSQVS